jgi:hypothetical protein
MNIKNFYNDLKINFLIELFYTIIFFLNMIIIFIISKKYKLI